MLNNILIQEMNHYQNNNIEEIKSSLREIGQKIILSGLARGKMFDYVAFYGGTSLRLLHNLDRFSEDLDFTLIKDNINFSLDSYLLSAIRELESYGIKATYTIKDKSVNTSVITGFVKFNLLDTLNLIYLDNKYAVNKNEMISIKVEVETKHYDGFNLEYKTVLYPAYFKVLTFDIETLFSCKILAVLNRKWKTRVKGRDYFDFLFYITNQIKPNYSFLQNALSIPNLSNSYLKELLFNRFNEVNFNDALNDVLPFIKNNSRFIPLFKKEIFIDLLNELK